MGSIRTGAYFTKQQLFANSWMGLSFWIWNTWQIWVIWLRGNKILWPCCKGLNWLSERIKIVLTFAREHNNRATTDSQRFVCGKGVAVWKIMASKAQERVKDFELRQRLQSGDWVARLPFVLEQSKHGFILFFFFKDLIWRLSVWHKHMESFNISLWNISQIWASTKRVSKRQDMVRRDKISKKHFAAPYSFLHSCQ